MPSKNETAAEQAGGAIQKAEVKRNALDVSTYRILSQSKEDVERAMNVFKNNLRGQKISALDLPRITVPAQGSTIWTVSTSEGQDHLEALTGVLIDYTTPRAYWDKPLTPGVTTPPSCSSNDGIRGIGDPGGDCATCEFNRYGTAKGEGQTGKACKEKRMLFLLGPDGALPAVIQAPSTSIRNLFRYMMGLANDGTDFPSIYTELTLEKVGVEPLPYSQIRFKNMGAVDPDYVTRIEVYLEKFTDIIDSGVEIVADNEVIEHPVHVVVDPETVGAA